MSSESQRTDDNVATRSMPSLQNVYCSYFEISTTVQYLNNLRATFYPRLKEFEIASRIVSIETKIEKWSHRVDRKRKQKPP